MYPDLKTVCSYIILSLFFIVTSPDSITTEHPLKKAIVLMSKHVLTRESSIIKTYYVRSRCTLLVLVLLS